MKVFNTATVLFVAVSSGSVLAATVEYCTGLSLGGTCFSASPADGTCVNVDLSVNDQTHSAQITDGNCVFWANANCNGDHTDQLDGTVDDFNSICGGGWQKRISAFKCCSGDASSSCVNDQTHSAEITDGNCVFWANADCDGDHTDQLDGTVDDFNTICGGGWQKRISSFKCCAGDSSATWCAGNKPACA
ncbi:hypothetical protein F5880DRAFT_1607062 [Lentinula raphanica]|nr:hypothetical protein F5880DRAFT_1607062 [Lentinula raphanica]